MCIIRRHFMPHSIDDRRVRSWDLRISPESRENVTILALAGRISARTSPILRRALDSVDRRSPAVVLDLTGVDYISSAGITLLNDIAASRTPGLVLFGLSDPVRIALDLAGFSPLLAVDVSLPQALARIAQKCTDELSGRVADEPGSDR
jgi:anti-anti-sigma factor